MIFLPLLFATQIDNLNLIGDHAGAVSAIEEIMSVDPSLGLHIQYVETLAMAGRSRDALVELSNLPPDAPGVEGALEAIAWSVMREGCRASSLETRATAVIGASLTRDSNACDFVVSALDSNNSLLKGLGLEVTPMLRDAVLKERVGPMLSDKVWEVRRSAIVAAGNLRDPSFWEPLSKIVASPDTTAEAKWAAMKSMALLGKGIREDEIVSLVKSKRAGLRELACFLVAELELKAWCPMLAPLLKDPIPHVRASALLAYGLCQRTPSYFPQGDIDKAVNVALGWWQLVSTQEEETLETALYNADVQIARLASGAIRKCGEKGCDLAKKHCQLHHDPFVRANLALLLIEQRSDMDLASAVLYDTLCSNAQMWMWDRSHSPLFEFLAPSTVWYNPEVIDLPGRIDHQTRLDVIGYLALCESDRATFALRSFLKEKGWGISGLAALQLMKEGPMPSMEMVGELLDDPDPEIRVQAALGLAIGAKDPSALSVLHGAYEEASRELKVHILEALGSVGDRSSVPFLVEVMQEPFPTLKIIAASSLVQCLQK